MVERGRFIEIWKIARALGWSVQRTRRRFKNAGWAVEMPGCHDLFVARERLVISMASVLVRIDELESAGMLRSTRGICKATGTRHVPLAKSKPR